MLHYLFVCLSLYVLCDAQTADIKNKSLRVAPPRRRTSLSSTDSETPQKIASISISSTLLTTDIVAKTRKSMREGRPLLQSVDDVTDDDCPFRRGQINRYLNQTSRTWLLNDSALQDLGDNLQSIVNCTRRGDILLLDTTREIQPPNRVTLLWPLTISAYVNSTVPMGNVFPLARQKVRFACPHENEGVFDVRSNDVTFANLLFSRCIFHAASGVNGVIVVDACPTQHRTGPLRLHHVSFRENQFLGRTSSGLRIRSPSCSAVDIVDTVFAENRCAGDACGALLSMENRIVRCTFVRNEKTGDAKTTPFLLVSPSAAQTVIIQIAASRNRIGIVRSFDGNLTLLKSNLRKNDVAAEEDTHTACIRIVRSEAAIEECVFEKNVGDVGVVVSAEGSVLDMRRSSFCGNAAKGGGGAVRLAGNSTASVRNCTFAENRAVYGGAIDVRGDSVCHLADCVFERNTANISGGALRVQNSSRLFIVNISMMANRAREDGGAFWLTDGSFANITDSRFVSNAAVNRGGDFYIQSSEVIMHNTLVQRSHARQNNDGIYAEASTVVIDASLPEMNQVVDSEGDHGTSDMETVMRSCMLGEEHPVDRPDVCEPCAIDAYNLHPEAESECLPCPSHGNCTFHVILSEKGHWHSTPCSTHIHECISSEACDSETRDRDLEELIQDVDRCEFDREYLKDYTEAQCREGHTGPLCGSCQESYGRFRSFRCEKCVSGYVNLLLVIASFLMLLFLSSITMRSNLTTALVSNLTESPTRRDLEKQASIQDASASGSRPDSGPSVIINEQMVEMIVSGYVPEEILHPEQRPVRRSAPDPHQVAKELELARWKTTELFKITVSFLQVTAIAIIVNVKWTATMFVLFEIAEFLSGITSETTRLSVECLIPEGSAIERSLLGTLISACIPLAVIFVFGSFWIVVFGIRRQSVVKLVRKIVLSALAVIYITYMPLCTIFASTLGCVKVYEYRDTTDPEIAMEYWALDTSVHCYHGFHTFLARAIGWPCFAFLVFVFPPGAAFLIWRSVQEDYKEGWIYEVAGFMYRSYRPRFVYWESMIMLKKASLVAIVVFSHPLGANVQYALAVFVLICSLYFQMTFRPYRQEFDELNSVESISVLVSSITFVSSILFHDDALSHGVRILITVTVASCNVILFGFLLSFTVICAAKFLRSTLEASDVPYHSEMGTLHVLKVYFVNYQIGNMKKALLRYFNKA